MTADAAGEVLVTFARGVLEDVAELTATSPSDEPEQTAEVEALKFRIAELLVECRANPFLGEAMGRGLHPEFADCRRGSASMSHRMAASLGSA